MFDNMLETKKWFQYNKNEKFKKSKNGDFFNGVS